jgi:hypothetical protein
MGIEDLVNQGKELFEQNRDKVEQALHSEQAEGISDKILDGAADLAKKVAPGAAEQIDSVRENVDKAVGNECDRSSHPERAVRFCAPPFAVPLIRFVTYTGCAAWGSVRREHCGGTVLEWLGDSSWGRPCASRGSSTDAPPCPRDGFVAPMIEAAGIPSRRRLLLGGSPPAGPPKTLGGAWGCLAQRRFAPSERRATRPGLQ